MNSRIKLKFIFRELTAAPHSAITTSILDSNRVLSDEVAITTPQLRLAISAKAF
jgi:hypothetical protein